MKMAATMPVTQPSQARHAALLRVAQLCGSNSGSSAPSGMPVGNFPDDEGTQTFADGGGAFCFLGYVYAYLSLTSFGTLQTILRNPLQILWPTTMQVGIWTRLWFCHGLENPTLYAVMIAAKAKAAADKARAEQRAKKEEVSMLRARLC